MVKKAKEEEITYTKYELARMIGSRALQIALGAPFLVKMDEKKLREISYDPIKIAKMEMEEGVLPIAIKRVVPSSEAQTAA